MTFWCDLRGWVENSKWKITKYNWWNTNLWIFDTPGQPYGKSYNLTAFIPHTLKVWLANRSKKK